MLENLYYEQNVKRAKPSLDKILRVIMIGMTIVNFILFAVLVSLYFFVPFMLFALLTFWYMRESRKEFDHILSNCMLETDIVRGANSRKELFTLDIRTELVVIAPSRSEPVQPWVGKKMKTWDCTSHTGVPYYCMIMKDKRNVEYKALFEPDETLLGMLKQMNPERVHRM